VVECFHPDRELMHATVVLLLLAERETQTIARGQVADDLCQAGTVVAGSAHVHSLTAAILRQMLGASSQAETGPSEQGLTEGQQKFVERADVDRQRVKSGILANQALL